MLPSFLFVRVGGGASYYDVTKTKCQKCRCITSLDLERVTPPRAMSTTPLALYRSLLRARAKAFRGDVRALDAARTEIRARFEDARDVDEKTRETKMREGREAEEFIRLHVVQAVREEDEENFKMTVDTVHQDVSIERADDDGKGGCSSGK